MRARSIASRLLAIGTLAAAGCGDSDSRPPDAPPPSPDATADAIPPPVDADGDFTAEQWATIATLSPLPEVPPDPTNAFADSEAAARLGQMLFFDKSYSGALVVGDDGTNGGLGMVGETGKVACASCHAVGSAALDDRRSTPNNVSLGVNFGTRNAHGMVNSSFYAWTNWGGRFDSQWSLPLAVAENAGLMRSTRLQIVHMLWTKYRTEYDAAFPVPLDPRLDPAHPDAADFPPVGKPKGATDPDGPWETDMTDADRAIANRIFANYGKAIAAYNRTLVSRDAPFDRFVAGDRTAISDAAKNGLRVFLEHCESCHGGPNFADDDFHALLAPQVGPHVPATDFGRWQDVPGLLASPFNTSGAYSDDTTTGKLDGLAQVDAQRGRFRTKSLRGVAASAPYMHAGQLATLDDVVAFYDAGGGDPGTTGIVKDPLIVPLALGAGDKADLVAFLPTLTGAPVPAERLVDTSK
jgi:cytochrome c peroxidase